MRLRSVCTLVAAVVLTVLTCAAAPPAQLILLDTDIGTDIDDAFALALIIKSPELQLLGVTTVSSDTVARARIAAKMLWQAGRQWRHIPVVAGVAGPKQDINQAAWADGFPVRQIHTESAVEFMHREIKSHPHKITLIAIGELTNIAALIRTYPETAKHLQRIVLMGGAIKRGYDEGSPAAAEWNIKSNPSAARVVFSSGIPITIAPLDITAMLKLGARSRARIFAQHTPLTNSLAKLYKLWKGETPTLFDPMAVAMLLQPGICETQKLAVAVDDQGYTRMVPGEPANASVGVSTDPAKFFDFYLERILGK